MPKIGWDCCWFSVRKIWCLKLASSMSWDCDPTRCNWRMSWGRNCSIAQYTDYPFVSLLKLPPSVLRASKLNWLRPAQFSRFCSLVWYQTNLVITWLYEQLIRPTLSSCDVSSFVLVSLIDVLKHFLWQDWCVLHSVLAGTILAVLAREWLECRIFRSLNNENCLRTTASRPFWGALHVVLSRTLWCCTSFRDIVWWHLHPLW